MTLLAPRNAVAFLLVVLLVAGWSLSRTSAPVHERDEARAAAPLGADAPLGDAETARRAALVARYDTNIPLVRYVWDARAGDPSVPAELGGPGFTGEGWETNAEFPALGSAQAQRGGTIVLRVRDFPATLRQMGQGWNQDFNLRARDLCYEALLDVHPITLELIPRLATHWWISPDKRTYRFRLNPSARFSDGSEVTAADVVATWRLEMDERILFPASRLVYGRMREPVARSKYLVEVEVVEESWRTFLDFATGLAIHPAAEVSIQGDQFLERYQFRYTASSGPYVGRVEDVKRGQSVTLRRREEWWDRDNPAWTGLWNFDAWVFDVVEDERLAFEKLKKGEIDYAWIYHSQWWAEELEATPAVKRGLLVKRKFFTDAPIGPRGLAVNMTRPPLDDRRIRLALCHLLDRELFAEQLFFNEYLPFSSYFQGGTYQSPDNRPTPYDELAAVELLEQAGWTALDREGYRTKDGKRLRFTLSYESTLEERHLTLYQEACKKAGIQLELARLDGNLRWRNLQAREYDLDSTGWKVGIFPSPRSEWHGSLAKTLDNNNVTGFSDPRVDELLGAYEREYDVAERIRIVRAIDRILFEAHPYVLAWYMPAQRVAYWNRFGMPESGGLRIQDHFELPYSWWVDPERERALAAARKDERATLPVPEVENHFWEAWRYAHEGR